MRSPPNFCTTAVIWLASILVHAAVISAGGSARVATWASKPVGPDGPWNVVEVSLGANQQSLSLFPGRQWQTVVPTSDYCSLNSSISHCGAGTYSKDRAIQENFGGVQIKTPVKQGVRGVPMVGSDLAIFYDDCDVVGPVPNCSLALVETQMLQYPNGQWYPLFAGCLSLGAPDVNQTYTQTNKPAINASIYPWWLENGIIPSSSFGIHIGSAGAAPMSGSLSFGGYDENRIVGDVLTSNGHFTDYIQLTDIGINSIKGSSPFDFQTKAGLLTAGNSSIPATGLNVSLDGCSPYLTLPRSTCDAIASHLPVIFNSSLGLYLWNTQDPKYKSILGSASALSLSITTAGNNKPITINIPFQHLNLTLTAPLVSPDVPYFPCFIGGTGEFVLGRAFMQDAFVGGSYDHAVWWLAQAPGPDIPLNPKVINLGLSDQSISGSGASWAATWNSTWSKSAEANAPSPPPPPPQSAGNNTQSLPSSGLSTGAKAGIGIGAGLGGLAIIAIAGWLFWRKNRKSGPSQESSLASQKPITEAYAPKDTTLGGYGPAEVPGTSTRDYHAYPQELE